jgi:hypothetical protein
MAYWIHENGETVGPLRGNEVLDRAKPDTLISHGEQWLGFDEHPDFAHLVQLVSSRATTNQQDPAIDGQAAESAHAQERVDAVESDERDLYWTWIRGSGPPTGPHTHQEVMNRMDIGLMVRDGDRWVTRAKHPDFQISYKPKRKTSTWLRAVIFVAVLGVVVLILLAVTKGTDDLGTDGDSVASAPTPANIDSHAIEDSDKKTPDIRSESQEALWAYSEPFDTLPLEPQFSTLEYEELVAGARAVIEDEVNFNVIDKIEGHTAWIDSKKWQDLDRTTQKLMLMNFAIKNCGCLDPGDWKAVFRSLTDELLASASPNGLRSLWTPDGMLPGRYLASSDVDVLSPMTEDERLDALKTLLEFTKNQLRNDYKVRQNAFIKQRLESEIFDLSAPVHEDEQTTPRRTGSSKPEIEPIRPPEFTTDEDGYVFLPAGGSETTPPGESASRDFPPWVPTYPESNPYEVYRRETGTSLSGGFSFETSDGVSHVIDFYLDSLQANGFKVTVNRFAGGKKEGGMVDGNNASTRSQVKVFLTSEGGTTKAEVSFSRK